MRKADAAEWILSLVSEPDRASSTTGDLLEQTAGRNAVWFWLSVARITASHLVSDLRAARGRMIWLAIRGVLAYVPLAFFAVLAMVAPIGIWMAISWFLGTPRDFHVPSWYGYAAAAIVETAIPFVIGQSIAENSRGRELAAGFAFAFVLAALGAISAFSGNPAVSANPAYPQVGFPISALAQSAFAIAGAICCRRRSLGRPHAA